MMHFRIKLRLLAKTRRSPGDKVYVMYRWFVLNTSQMLKLMMAELRAQAIAGVFTTFAFRENMMGATKFVRSGPILARRRAKAALYRVGVRVRSTEPPFQDFPRMRNWSVKNVRNWLGKNGFLKVEDPVVTQDGFTAPRGAARSGSGKAESGKERSRPCGSMPGPQAAGQVPRYELSSAPAGRQSGSRRTASHAQRADRLERSGRLLERRHPTRRKVLGAAFVR